MNEKIAKLIVNRTYIGLLGTRENSAAVHFFSKAIVRTSD